LVYLFDIDTVQLYMVVSDVARRDARIHLMPWLPSPYTRTQSDVCHFLSIEMPYCDESLLFTVAPEFE
jgi:hypothetical protein